MTAHHFVNRKTLLLAFCLYGAIRVTSAASPPAYYVTDLGTLPGMPKSIATDINNSGHVVGRSITSDELWRAFLWTPSTPNGVTGAMSDLGTLGGSQSYAGG